MPLDVPARIPPNNLRLPEALTVRHGPGPLLARFILAADKAARRRGITIRVRHDFDGLCDINKFYVDKRLWYPMIDAFNPRCSDLRPDNAFWLSGENENGEIVLTNACKIMDLTGTNLAEQARTLWYGSDKGQACDITAKAAWEISGIVAWGGAAWVHPDYRGRHLSYVTPRILKAYACATWPVDWSICYIGADNVSKGLAAVYGHQNLSHSICYPDSPAGELVLAYSTAEAFYSDIASFMARGSAMDAADFEFSDVPVGLEHMVMNTSPDGVFQGNINRS